MLLLRSCPRCTGALSLEDDLEAGPELCCLTCGYRRSVALRPRRAPEPIPYGPMKPGASVAHPDGVLATLRRYAATHGGHIDVEAVAHDLVQRGRGETLTYTIRLVRSALHSNPREFRRVDAYHWQRVEVA